MWVFIGIIAIACVICFIIGDKQEKKKKQENPQPEVEADKIKSVLSRFFKANLKISN